MLPECIKLAEFEPVPSPEIDNAITNKITP